MNAAKARKRESGPAPDYPPMLRLDVPVKRIVIEDLRFGSRHELLLFISVHRRNSFRVEMDGKPWKDCIGYSRLLAGIRKAR